MAGSPAARDARVDERRSAQRGFTLLEVLVAVSLMAVLAILCWRGLDAVLAARDRIQAESDEIRALSVAFTQLDEDLRRSWPVRTLGLPQPSLLFQPAGEAGYALVLLREGAGDEGLRLQQVVYRLNAGVLERGFSRWRSTGFDQALELDTLTWQPLINGVQGVAFRAWLPGTGWLAGESLGSLAAQAAAAREKARAARQALSAALSAGGGTGPVPGAGANAPAPATEAALTEPAGVEMTLNRRGERIVRLFAIED